MIQINRVTVCRLFASCKRLLKTSNAAHCHVQCEQNSEESSDIEAQSDDEFYVPNRPHIPVMVKEVLNYLNLSPGDQIVDGTFGAGGHSTQILKAVPGITIFALDRDPLANKYANKMAENYPGQIIPLLGRFSELPELLKKYKVKENSIDAFLFDYGTSSMQFDIPERGFSIQRNGPLDMRMDGFRNPNTPTAADVLSRASEEELARIIKYYGEEKQAKKIARAIIEARFSFRKLETTKELAQLVESVLTDEEQTDRVGRFQHVATKTFQAIRIFVNNELNEINYSVLLAHKYLKLGGRLITLSFHSLEDTIIKRHLSGNVSDCKANVLPLKYVDYNKCFNNEELSNLVDPKWEMLHKHVLKPTNVEVRQNPRARSAKFRALVKIK